ncbi:MULTISPECIES: DUF2534 family protein [Cedecea]|uniref:DUF2534 family protein n=2 Tax=Cedecea davisae TaxID=158484 RepID=S3JRS5_9ENTR|nr:MULTISPECIES: DUF2534 family protein [Cedecea]EPF15914.1 hypothetical protein HMPREF0201_03089 [Cedecea davisae DSM 4568]MBU4683111.1 DUF2534 family protein [Cedecea davisae]MBU4687791.1 DUF2534 family protein [Cedecea davisae]QIX97059.1 DUF2534 family protein [Cedecea sp. FDAARGOS_727]SUX38530.1 Protein of uncharacterised function (DUF2534) [Cedecea davisae]
MFAKLRTRDGKKFLIAVAIVFTIVVSLISKVTFEGVEEQYNWPMEQWTLDMFIMQGAWVAIYTIMFTILCSTPFAFYFLAPKDGRG